MKRSQNSLYAKILTISLAASLIAASTAAKSAQAMFLSVAPSRDSRVLYGPGSDILIVQRALESRIIEQRLRDVGLSPDTAQEKIKSLSDEQIRKLAQNVRVIDAGGQMHGGIQGGVGVSGYVYGPLELTAIVLLILLIIIIAQEDATNRIVCSAAGPFGQDVMLIFSG